MTDNAVSETIKTLLTPDGCGARAKATRLVELCCSTNPNIVRQKVKNIMSETNLIYSIGELDRTKVLKAIDQSTDPKADAFAKTFIGKADRQKMWDKAKGVYDIDGNLLAMSITTITKRHPISANLQLMHTFTKYRGKGIGKLLVDDAFDIAAEAGCEYFRVSAERAAVGFYAKCGIPFLGIQKSGTFLSLFSLTGPRERFTYHIKNVVTTRNGRISLDRCNNPNKLEQVTIEALGDKYLYEKLMTWSPAISG